MSDEFNPDLTGYLFDRAAAQCIPLGGTFELTPICNMNCRMCYIRMNEEQMKAKGRLRTVSEWLNLAQQAKDAGMLFLLITGGEPLLYPGFRELFTELKKMGLFVSINTNAIMIDADAVEFFKKYPPYRINITLYGGSDDAYKRLCRYENGYDKVINAIRMLKEAGLSVKINCSITSENMSDAEKILSMAKDFSTACSLGCYMFPPTRRDDKSTSRFTPEEAGKCQAVVDSCWRIINESIRNAVALKGCEGCKDRALCKVCPAIAAAETGDYNKKPEYLCRMIDVWKKEMLKLS